MKRFLSSFAVILLLCSLAWGKQEAPWLPDPELTPGDTMPGVTKEQVCVVGYTKTVRHVPKAMSNAVYKEYGMDPKNHLPCEVDHFLSLELGGSNDIKNLWPQPYDGEWGARKKDALETHLHKMVCEGKITLEEAQAEVKSDWTKAYQKYMLGKQPVENKGYVKPPPVE